MQYTVPHYYKKFCCSGSECPDTCCAGWQIMIDRRSLKKYRRQKDALGSRLHNEIDWQEGCFKQYDGRCAFLNEDNLCDLYIEGGGADMFCRTCRTYPRHIEEFEGLREISLSLSCPEAAHLILTCREPVRFLHAENLDRTEEYEDFDFLLFTKLEDLREQILCILQNREQPFALRCMMALALAHDAQERLDRNMIFEIDSLIARYGTESAWEWFAWRKHKLFPEGIPTAERMRTLHALFSLLDSLEVLREDWRDYRSLAQEAVFMVEEPEQKEAGIKPTFHREFSRMFTDTMQEQLAVYFVFTYLCGAVYDRQVYGKMKFALASAVLIRELAKGCFIRQNKNIQIREIEEAARRYSREVEHSDLNKCRMEELLLQEETFGLERMFLLFE